MHSEKHYVAMEKTQEMSDGELLGRACGYNSIYLHQVCSGYHVNTLVSFLL